MSIKNNITSLQSLLQRVNALPEAGGAELPKLTNKGSASDLLSGKQLIDQNGNIVTGTFTIDSELSTQDDLISQIQAVVDNLPEAGDGGSSGGSSIETCTLNFTLNDPSNNFAMGYHTYENGKVLSHFHMYGDTIPTTITNFISNSTLTVYKYNNNYSLGQDSNCTLISSFTLAPLFVYKITATSGQIVNITIMYNDF